MLSIHAQSPTYGLQTLPKIVRTPTPTTTSTAVKAAPAPTPATASLPASVPTLSITPSGNQLPELICSPLPKRSLVSRGSVPDARQLMYIAGAPKQRYVHSTSLPSPLGTRTNQFPNLFLSHSDASFLPTCVMDYARSADISECSTNTDEYATCTDTSKRTPGIKTPPTTTSSSSTTQVPGLGLSLVLCIVYVVRVPLTTVTTHSGQSSKQSINQLINQSIQQSNNQTINQSFSQSVNKAAHPTRFQLVYSTLSSISLSFSLCLSFALCTAHASSSSTTPTSSVCCCCLARSALAV